MPPKYKKQRGPGRKIQKGQVLNPLGGKAHDPVKKALRALSGKEILEAGLLVIQNGLPELKELMASGTLPAIQHALVKQVVDAIENGSTDKLEFLMDRLIGPVVVKTEMTGADGAPLIPAIRTPEERAADLATMMALREKLASGKS